MAEFTCPCCGGMFEAEVEDRPQTVGCPHCGQAVEVREEEQREEELDESRIRRIVELRRSEQRARSYRLIGALLLLLGAAAQAAWMGYWVAAVLVAGVGGWLLIRGK